MPGSVKRFSFQPSVPLSEDGLALSPDGKRLVYQARGPSGRQLYLRALDELDAKALAGTEGGRSPFFSPGGQWVAFVAGEKLKKVSIGGGAPVTICDVRAMLEGGWGSDVYVRSLYGPPGYDVTADGQRFLMVKPADSERVPPSINIVTDWFQELTRRVPTAR